jgi:hypothetical protein
MYYPMIHVERRGDLWIGSFRTDTDTSTVLRMTPPLPGATLAFAAALHQVELYMIEQESQ